MAFWGCSARKVKTETESLTLITLTLSQWTGVQISILKKALFRA